MEQTEVELRAFLVFSAVLKYNNVAVCCQKRLIQGSMNGAVVRAFCLPPMWPRFNSRTRRQMWVEFVVGSRPCPKRFFSGYSGFPLSSKTNISKFQFDLESEGHRFVSRNRLLNCHPPQTKLILSMYLSSSLILTGAVTLIILTNVYFVSVE